MYEDLYYAITLQAVIDYTQARDYINEHQKEYDKTVKRKKDGTMTQDDVDLRVTFHQMENLKADAESFFHSQDCYLLSGIEGELILKEIEKIPYKQIRRRIGRMGK